MGAHGAVQVEKRGPPKRTRYYTDRPFWLKRQLLLNDNNQAPTPSSHGAAAGSPLVVARNGNLLKRFVAAPARRSQILGAQLASRLIFLVPEAGALLVFAHLALDVPIRGSLLLLVVISLIGALSFSGLGLLAAARPTTIEGVSGIMNLVMVPMWIFSGIFFSTERFPATMQPFVQALPLTALNDALRAVMLEGTGVGPVLHELALLAVWGTLSFVIAVKVFRWQ